jgi:aminoglycoside phosphotransferase (APT) family kinase protein
VLDQPRVPVWSPELVIDEPLVRRLLAQLPELDVHSLRRLAEGWDNSVWIVNERYAFRFPQREVAIPGVERELEVLPQLPALPLAVPRPLFVGRPEHGFPWPFFGSELLNGVEAGDADLDDGARVEVGVELARFLRELHALELDVALPLDANRRTDMQRRATLAREQLAEVGKLGVWSAPPRVEELLAEAQRLPPPERPVLVHGDLHFRHLLVDGGAASGVIDWGDVCRADPAIDLLLLWSFLPPDGRVAFLGAYGPVNEAQLLRARVLAIQLCAALAEYGRVERNESVEREAVAGLERALRD